MANQESADYGPNYHARSDTFDKVDLAQLRLNAAIAAALVWGFAEMDVDWGRQTRSEIQALIDQRAAKLSGRVKRAADRAYLDALPHELTAADNPAIGAALFGYLAGVVIVLVGLYFGYRGFA